MSRVEGRSAEPGATPDFGGSPAGSRRTPAADRVVVRKGPAHGDSPGVLVCDVVELGEPDMGTVDGFARLALRARRRGRDLRLVGASPQLRSLLELAGLRSVLPCDPRPMAEPRSVEMRREA